MNLKILSAAFLVDVSTIPLAAQMPPNPPVPLTCTNASDTLCNDAAAVYNAIIANPPVSATSDFAKKVAALQSLLNNPRSGASLQAAVDVESKYCNPFTQKCGRLVGDMGVFIFVTIPKVSSLFPSQTVMNNLIEKKGNMSSLNPAPFSTLVVGFNTLAADMNALLPPARSPKSNNSLPEISTKGAAPVKK